MDKKDNNFDEIQKILDSIPDVDGEDSPSENEKFSETDNIKDSDFSLSEEGLFPNDNSEDEDYTDINEEVTEPDTGNKTALNEIFEWVESVAISVVFVVLLFTFVFRVVMVDGESMRETLQNEDRVVISNFLYTPKADDIIVFVPSIKDYENKPFVKRVIATEGQTITVDAKKGAVYINGIEIEEPYIREVLTKQGDQQYPLTVPEGYVFAMGDNRNDSWDSRFVAVGIVDTRSILGRVVYRVFPFNKIGKVK